MHAVKVSLKVSLKYYQLHTFPEFLNKIKACDFGLEEQILKFLIEN